MIKRSGGKQKGPAKQTYVYDLVLPRHNGWQFLKGATKRFTVLLMAWRYICFPPFSNSMDTRKLAKEHSGYGNGLFSI